MALVTFLIAISAASISHGMESASTLMTGAEHFINIGSSVVTAVTALGSGIGGTLVGLYKVKKDVKHAAAEAITSGAADAAAIAEARHKLAENTLVTYQEKLSELEALAKSTRADLDTLQIAFKIVVAERVRTTVKDGD